MTRLDRMRKDYERFTKAEGYIIGFPVGETVYASRIDKIPRRYTRVRKEMSGDYGLYLYINNRKYKAQLMKTAFPICSLADLNGKYNKGVMFEKKVVEHYGGTFRGKDTVPFYISGDFKLDGKEIQIKYLSARFCYNKTLEKLKKSA